MDFAVDEFVVGAVGAGAFLEFGRPATELVQVARLREEAMILAKWGNAGHSDVGFWKA